MSLAPPTGISSTRHPANAAARSALAMMLSVAGWAIFPWNAAHADQGDAQGAKTDAPAPTPALTVGGSVSLVSDYLVRGISQTQHQPTAQAELDFTHASGWYGTVFGSGVSGAVYPSGDGVEIDLITGWRFALPASFGLDLSYNAYFYPGSHTSDGVKFDTQEIKAALSRDAFSVGMAVVTSSYLSGIYNVDAQGNRPKTQGSLYLEANWNPALTEGITLNLHAGHEHVRNASAFSFADYKIGLTLDGKRLNLPGWTASLAWSYNNGNRTLWTFTDSDGNSKVGVGSRVVASIAYNF